MAQNTRGFLTFDPFMPGQLGGLATDLSTFGGTRADWKDYLRDTTMPTMVPVSAAARNRWGNRGGRGGDGGGGKGDGGGGGKGGKDDTPATFDPSRPDHRMAPVMTQRPMVGTQQQGFLGAQTAQAPVQYGFLGRPQQMAAQSSLPPEIMAMISRGR